MPALGQENHCFKRLDSVIKQSQSVMDENEFNSMIISCDLKISCLVYILIKSGNVENILPSLTLIEFFT